MYNPEAPINVKSNLAAQSTEQEVAAGPAWLRRRGVSGSVRLAEAELPVFAEMFCHYTGRTELARNPSLLLLIILPPPASSHQPQPPTSPEPRLDAPNSDGI